MYSVITLSLTSFVLVVVVVGINVFSVIENVTMYTIPIILSFNMYEKTVLITSHVMFLSPLRKATIYVDSVDAMFAGIQTPDKLSVNVFFSPHPSYNMFLTFSDTFGVGVGVGLIDFTFFP